MQHGLHEPDRHVSREEYRSWCAVQPNGRYERIEGRVVAMAPERAGHLRAKAAVYIALARAIIAAGLDCEALPDGATVETGDSDYEPDALVNRGERMRDDAVAAPNPVIVVEVLSPGTASADTGAKLAGYFRVPSILHYLIIHPTRHVVVHHRRSTTAIETSIIHGGSITLSPPGLVITMDELYP